MSITKQSQSRQRIARDRQSVEDAVNIAIASLLPVPPRDFEVSVKLEPKPGKPGTYKSNVRIMANTDMGQAILPVLKRKLRGELANNKEGVWPPANDDDPITLTLD